MTEVAELFPGQLFKTRVWVSEQATKEIERYVRRDREKGRRFLDKLERYAKNGFELYEGDKSPIRPEWNGIFRIGEHSSLFRLCGFYENDKKSDFVIVDAFLKRGQKLSRNDIDRINEVARIKREDDWSRKQ